MSIRSPEIREVARTLATLGLLRIRKGSTLNVRRTQSVRRALAKAARPLRWSEVAALDEDPVEVAAKDLEKIVQKGTRLLKRGLSEELEEIEAQASRLEAAVATLRQIAEDTEVDAPLVITYAHTSRSPTRGLIQKTETLTVTDPEEALEAARKIEGSLPQWARLREQVLDDLRCRQERLELLGRNVSEVVESWRGLLRDVLVTMP